MADNVDVTPGSGATIATDEVSSRHFQLVKPAFGADGSATLVAADAGLPVQSGYKELSGSASANNTDLASADVNGYRWVAIQLTGSFTATVKLQHSNDNSNWVDMLIRDTSSVSNAPTNTMSSTGMYTAPIVARYLRIRTSSYTSGTVNGAAFLASVPPPQFHTAVAAYGGSTFTDGSTPTYWGAVQGLNGVYNGTSWDRTRSMGATGIQGVTPTPGTTGGWAASSQTALSSTKTQIKASAGTVGGWMIWNPNTSVAHVQVWDVANGSITVGTTAPTYVLSIPPSSSANLELTCGINHATAINVAATTTPTGSTAPTSALVCAFFYK